MMFSNDFLHFLKIKNFFCRIHQNYLVALIWCVPDDTKRTVKTTLQEIHLIKQNRDTPCVYPASSSSSSLEKIEYMC